ncbi:MULTISPECIES: linear amide C-N hydrolase [Vreelandella]|uniref:Linear amide C-N hydrolase n=2 Tax=Vreelandella TaxID=3137766 RepID=A0A7C9NL71_9GAMM|nr:MULTISPECIES: linear amide C-N hydrolase [Halomonas]NDL69049.1 linear amide C-N hydrolase [Halomonas alkaliphila]NYS44239.1 linear amide C-N hydrolase [Halomonas zhaodongensis]
MLPLSKSRLAALCIAIASTAVAPTALACTSLLYTDSNDKFYAGRTMELPMELPYKVSYFPAGTTFGSQADKHHVLDFTGQNAFVSISVPDPVSGDVKVAEGVNDKGLTFSVLAFASTEGPADMVDNTQAVLSAIDLGAWTLSQFGTVDEVKAALEEQPVLVTSLLPHGLLKTPFHYTLHDATGKSIVIEFANGEQNIIDNPLGVMTNGPEFSWHMTNLNNYTFLSNKDQSKLELNGVKFVQPDSGIATAGLPASNTSVGRFVRAVYYSQFAEKAKDADSAITTLSRVMNNFDRPRGITIDNRFRDSIENITAPGVTDNRVYTSEYTSWTSLIDLQQRQLHIRTYDNLNYVQFDLDALSDINEVRHVELKDVASGPRDATVAFHQ